MSLKLKSYGVRLTSLNKELYASFEKANKPLNSKELAELITCSFNPASLFRAINRFIQARIIKVDKVNEKDGAYYSLVSMHQHFITCRGCGETQNLDSCSIGPMIKKAKAMGFTNLEHRLEIQGECQQCA